MHDTTSPTEPAGLPRTLDVALEYAMAFGAAGPRSQAQAEAVLQAYVARQKGGGWAMRKGEVYVGGGPTDCLHG